MVGDPARHLFVALRDLLRDFPVKYPRYRHFDNYFEWVAYYRGEPIRFRASWVRLNSFLRGSSSNSSFLKVSIYTMERAVYGFYNNGRYSIRRGNKAWFIREVKRHLKWHKTVWRAKVQRKDKMVNLRKFDGSVRKLVDHGFDLSKLQKRLERAFRAGSTV